MDLMGNIWYIFCSHRIKDFLGWGFEFKQEIIRVSLIKVLIALVILSISLLGIAGLMAMTTLGSPVKEWQAPADIKKNY